MAMHDGLLQPVLARPRLTGMALGVGLLLGAGVYGLREHTRPHSYLLELDAQRRDTALYYSAFGPDDVVADHDQSDGKPIVYRTDFPWVDGCTWQAVETLTPETGGYAYAYDEHVVSCPADLEPDGVPSPLKGHVRVTQLSERRPATSLFGYMLDAVP